MKMTGELVEDKIIIQKPKEVGRLYNKSHFGKAISGEKLELDLMEGCFLLDEEKIRIFEKKEEEKIQDIIFLASKNIKNFDVKYSVFKDLRKRGHSVGLTRDKSDVDLSDFKEGFCVSVFSEKDFFDIKKTINLTKKLVDKNHGLWFAVVDDEGDVTYYDVSFAELNGNNKSAKYAKKDGFLIDNHILVFDKVLVKSLFENEFYGKKFGTGLQLSLIEGAYLSEKKSIDIKKITNEKISKKDLLKILKEKDRDFDKKYAVYKDLKKRGLIVKTGFKFGTDFRAYRKNPDKVHAEYLVQVVENNFKSIWSEMSRAIRLGHSVNKEIIFARASSKEIDYIGFGRLRP